MAELSFTERELLAARARAKSELKGFLLEDKIKRYTDSDGLDDKGRIVLDSLSNCFSLYFLARDKLSETLASNEGKVFASIYSMHIAAQYGYSLLGNDDEEGQARVIDDSSNIFLGTHHIDLSSGPMSQCRSFINDLSKSLSNGYNKQLEEIVKDFYGYVVEETKKAAENQRFAQYHHVLRQNQVRYGGLIFNGFSEGADAGVEPAAVLNWGMMEGYEHIKKAFRSYAAIISRFDEISRYWKDASNLAPNLILDGPSGTGKSLSARIFGSIMQSMGMHYTEINFGHIADSYVNGAAKKLAFYFDRAEKPVKRGISRFSVLYVDEVDALAMKRGASCSGEDEKVTSLLKARIGEGNQVPGLIFIGSTNYARNFPDELLRRCEILRYELPTKDVQAKLFGHFFAVNRGEKNICGEMDYLKIAEHAVHHGSPEKRYSAGHIKNIVKMAVRNSVTGAVMGNGRIKPIDTSCMIEQINNYSKSRNFTDD